MVQKEKKKNSNVWLVLVTVMIASFLGRLDGTIVNLALPKIISDFGITISQASWISTAYIIASAIFVPIFGKLGDLIGRKPLYLFGIIGFVITSMLAGLSFNLQSLVFFRVLQAITVSIDYPLALSIISFTFTDQRARAQAMGMWSAIFAAASIFGPLLGGPLIDAFSWRAVFYVNIPLGIIATLMAIRFIEEPVKKIKGIKDFDILGSLLLGVCLGTLVYVLNQGQSWGWDSLKSIISYIIVLVSFVAFIITEKGQAEPVVDLKFFKNVVFTSSIITSFISFLGMIGGIFLLPLFVQDWLGYSVTKSGYVFIPMALSLLVAAPVGGYLAGKIQPRFLTSFGMTVACIAMFLFSGIDIKWTFFDITWRLMLFATGLGLGLSPLTHAATSTVPPEEVGVASSVLALARNISGAFGVAIFATILTNATSSNLVTLEQHTIINSLSPSVFQIVSGLMIVKANVIAYQQIFRIAAVLLLIGGFTALFVREDPKMFEHKGKKRENAIIEV